jgi:hypothetical protein
VAELKTIFTADTSGLNSAIGKAQSGIGGLASKLGAMFAGTAALGYVKSLIDAQSAIKDTADAVGVSTTMLQGMREMGKDVGVEFGKIQTALNKIDASRLDAIKDKNGWQVTLIDIASAVRSWITRRPSVDAAIVVTLD